MFRVQENIPECYLSNSRDMQLLCRIKDVVFNSVKYNIDSIRHTANTLEMNSTLLPLLKSKVGFFKSENLNEDQLRYLVAGFPYLIKYKGSKKAIQAAVNLWFRVNQIGGELVSLEVKNFDQNRNPIYELTLNISGNPYNTDLLEALIAYILPTGYNIKYHFGTSRDYSSSFKLKESYRRISADTILNSAIQQDKIFNDSYAKQSNKPTDYADLKKDLATFGNIEIVREDEILENQYWNDYANLTEPDDSQPIGGAT